jgi:hypothetical protein
MSARIISRDPPGYMTPDLIDFLDALVPGLQTASGCKCPLRLGRSRSATYYDSLEQAIYFGSDVFRFFKIGTDWEFDLHSAAALAYLGAHEFSHAFAHKLEGTDRILMAMFFIGRIETTTRRRMTKALHDYLRTGVSDNELNYLSG